MPSLNKIEHALGIRWKDKGLYGKLCSIIPGFSDIREGFEKDFENGIKIKTNESETTSYLGKTASGDVTFIDVIQPKTKMQLLLTQGLDNIAKGAAWFGAYSSDDFHTMQNPKIAVSACAVMMHTVQADIGLKDNVIMTLIDHNAGKAYELKVNQHKKEARLIRSCDLAASPIEDLSDVMKPANKITRQEFLAHIFSPKFKEAFGGFSAILN